MTKLSQPSPSNIVFLTASLMLASACDPSTPGTDAGPGTDSGGSSGACNDVANVGSPVAKTADPASVPTMTGGTIADGTYVLTSTVDYGTDTPGTTQHTETWVFSGGNGESVVLAEGVEERYAFTYTTSGSSFTMNIACPTAASFTTPYSADATSFTFVHPDDPNEVSVYTKQ